MEKNEMFVPEISQSIAEALALFHTLEMPLQKEPHWLLDTITKYK